MSRILVSIIMPVYNVEDYIKESLMSIANQTFTAFELIIVNDGSTDNSVRIINDFINQYRNLKIKYYYQNNEGQSSARNKGIRAAEGIYIYFFDSDDLIKSTAIELLYEQSTKNNLDLLLFSGKSFFETSDVQAKKYQFNYIKKENYPLVLDGDEIFVELIKNHEYSTSPCLYFVKKSTLMKYKLNFYEGIIHEDALFTFQLILSAGHSKVINDILFFRRVRDNSTMTARNHVKSFLGNYTVLIEMIKFQKKIQKKNSELTYAIHNRLLDAFGNAVNQYIYMNKEEQSKYSEQLYELKNIGKEYNYFGRSDYWLFGKQIFIYTLFRKSFDYLKQRKGKL